MDEIWKEIDGTDYLVSDLGRVASTARGMRVRKLGKDPKGYRFVDIWVGTSKPVWRNVHPPTQRNHA